MAHHILGSSGGPPHQAANVGYNDRTFFGSFARNTINLSGDKSGGYDWYFNLPNSALNLEFGNQPGVITITQNSMSNQSTIQTFTSPSTGAWHGLAFGGGGYFECSIAFDYTTIVNTPNGWPSWWTYSWEHLRTQTGAGTLDQWPGQPAGLEFFIEADIMEKIDNSNPAYYLGQSHAHWGVFGSPGFGCSGTNYCDIDRGAAGVIVPGGNIPFNNWNRYGLLWVPATSMTDGYMSYWFNGVQQGPATTWTQFTNQAPPPGTPPSTAEPWAFGIFDLQHVCLNLGTGPNTPMRVRDLVVWQKNSASNLRN